MVAERYQMNLIKKCFHTMTNKVVEYSDSINLGDYRQLGNLIHNKSYPHARFSAKNVHSEQ